MSPQKIPSRQSERVPWSLRDCRALVALREAHPYDLCLASSFPLLPSPNRRLVLHPTLGRLVSFGKRPQADCKISKQRHGSLPKRSPKFCRLRPLACPILVFRCPASFAPSPSGCSTSPACCSQWVSTHHRLARPSLGVEWREITSPHSGGKRPCSSARFARKSRIHA